jgi:hypothetical protein
MGFAWERKKWDNKMYLHRETISNAAGETKVGTRTTRKSCAEPVERAAGALEGVDDVEGRDGFAV